MKERNFSEVGDVSLDMGDIYNTRQTWPEKSLSSSSYQDNSKHTEQGKYIESSKREIPSHVSSRPVRMTEYYLTENLKAKSV